MVSSVRFVVGLEHQTDETKFKKLAQNPTKSREDSLISFLRKLKRDKIIDDARRRYTTMWLYSRCPLWPS